jgi:hypothetical protein
LDNAIEQEIKSQYKIRNPGLVVILVPKAYGSSTSMLRTLNKLKADGTIHDYKFLDYQKDPRMTYDTGYEMRKNNSGRHSVFVIDNNDYRINTAENMRNLRRFCDNYAMMSVGYPYQFFMITHRPDIAKEMLTINDGAKVHLLGSYIDFVNGTPGCHKDYWGHFGLKLREKEVRKYISDESIVKLCAKAGTIGFMLKALEGHSLEYLEVLADKQAEEWSLCGQVTEHWWLRTNAASEISK